MTAQPQVNVEKAKDIREKILSIMEGKTTHAYKFQKADQAVTLAFRSTVKVSGKRIIVDPPTTISKIADG